MIINYLLPEPLRDFQTRFPAARVGLYELSPAAMAHAVKTDRLDLGFHYAHLRDAALETSRLGTLPSHVYASKAYLKKHGRPAGLRALLKHPFIAPRAWEEDPTAPRADGFPDHAHPRTVRYETELLETHLRFVLSGLCVGVLPDFIAEGKAVALPGPEISRTIYCFRRAGRPLHPAAAQIIESLKIRIRLAGGKGDA
jgi:DNA-binding transcriptional LysR family regulator